MRKSTLQKALFANYKSQLALFRRSTRNLQEQLRALKRIHVAARVAEIVEEMEIRSTAFERIYAAASTIPASVPTHERTKFLLGPERNELNPPAYQFMYHGKLAERALTYFEERPVLLMEASAVVNEYDAAKASGDKESMQKLGDRSWLLAAGHDSIDAFVVQAQAIMAAEAAILHSQNVEFWQGRQQYFRYEGDRLDEKFDCPSVRT